MAWGEEAAERHEMDQPMDLLREDGSPRLPTERFAVQNPPLQVKPRDDKTSLFLQNMRAEIDRVAAREKALQDLPAHFDLKAEEAELAGNVMSKHAYLQAAADLREVLGR